MKKLFGLLFLFSVVCCSSAIIETPVSAEKGVIDFTASGMQQNIRYSLNGEWEFYWNRLLTPEDFTAMSSNRDINYIAVPSIWNGYRPDIDAEGYATYRLTLILPTTNEDYAFKISTIATAYRFYLNGVLIASNGVVGTNVQSTYAQSLPRLFYFFGAKMTNEIIIQAANFIHPKGGIWESISVGYFRSMVQINDFERLFEAFVVGILIFIAVYHLILFLYRRKERIFLFICLLCVLMAIRISLTGEYLSAYVNPQFDWELGRRILIASFYLGVIVLMGYFQNLYKPIARNPLLLGTQIVYFVLTTLTLLLPIRIFYALLYFGLIFCAIPFSLLLFYSIRSVFRREENSIVFLLQIALIIVIIAHDSAITVQWIYGRNWLALGILFVMMMQTFQTASVFMKTFTKVELLSGELEIKNFRLKSWGDKLEAVVESRTRELQAEMRERSQKEEELRKLYASVLEDIETASITQSYLLPNWLTLGSNIVFSSVYAPSQKVGGDIFDIIPVSPTQYWIYIGDVSGHGVQAALLMTAVKSELRRLIHDERIHPKPFQVVHALNQILCKEVFVENYMTLFIAFIDLDKRTMEYYNAGHPPLIEYNTQTGEVVQHPFRGSYPIGWMPTHEFYEEESEKLTLSDRILYILYTDGVYECINSETSKGLGRELLAPFIRSKIASPDCPTFPFLLKQHLEESGYRTDFDDFCVFVFQTGDQYDDFYLMIDYELTARNDLVPTLMSHTADFILAKGKLPKRTRKIVASGILVSFDFSSVGADQILLESVETFYKDYFHHFAKQNIRHKKEIGLFVELRMLDSELQIRILEKDGDQPLPELRVPVFSRNRVLQLTETVARFPL